MSGKKRFYLKDIEKAWWVKDRNNYGRSLISDGLVFTREAAREYCDLLNKGHEATNNLHDISDDDLLSELRRRINAANEQELDDWITATYDLHDDACLTEPEQ